MRCKPLGRFLVEEGFISPRELSLALIEQERLRAKRIGEILVELGLLDERTLDHVVAEQLARLTSDDGDRPLPLGLQLAEDGWISEQQLAQALQRQTKYRTMRIGDILVRLRYIDRRTLEDAILQQLQELAVA